MSMLKRILGNITPTKRTLFFVLADGFIFVFSLLVSYILKFGIREEVISFPYGYILNAIPLFMIVKYIVYFKLRLYQITWQYVGLNDLFNLLKANLISSGIIVLIYYIGYGNVPGWLPKSVIFAEFFISFILAGSLRISKRVFMEIFKPARLQRGKKTLIVGAGGTGEMIMRDMRKNNFEDYLPVAFLDNDRRKWNTYLHDRPVLGDINLLEDTVRNLDIQAVMIADHDLSLKEVKELYTTARRLDLKEIKIVPKLYSLTNVDITVKKLADIHVEDLINRQEIQVETEKIARFIENKKVLVTGAAGSIGSEIVRQIMLFNPEIIIIFEIDETEVFNLEKEIRERFPEMMTRTISVIGDIRDKHKVEAVFRRYKPDIIFSAAAYKHVPLMETNPDEAVKVNLFGTYNLCSAAHQNKVEKFINISTDKAVKPLSVMGRTKRIGEYIIQAFNNMSDTQYISVRFGNVLGSRGSVIPIFLDQIQKGGPVTVTHEDMKRYFMTIPESVTLVLQATLLGKGGEVMVLDMGEPILIKQIAEELIKLHNMEPTRDIEITYTGIRPGEKIFEEILTAEEGTNKTTHERVYVAIQSMKYSLTDIDELLSDFDKVIKNNWDDDLMKRMISDALKM